MKKILNPLLCVLLLGLSGSYSLAQLPNNYTYTTTAADKDKQAQASAKTPLHAWPFGSGYHSIKSLHIAKKDTFHLPCGTEADFDTIQIDKGGVLMVDDYKGKSLAWTIIGCKGPFILNGTIIVQNMNRRYAVNHDWPLLEPDSTGKLSIFSISAKTTQSRGGSGGNGNSGNFAYVAQGGNQYDGNGGGGGGTGFIHCCPIQVDTGGNANDTMSGFGGAVKSIVPNQYLKSPREKLYGNSGEDLNTFTGGSGGTRGMNGGLLYIKALQSITGKGTIEACGTDGGSGGNVPYHAGSRFENIRSGGAGGGGAGGSGGFIYIKYQGPEPTIKINVKAGRGGDGGRADYAGKLPNQDGEEGQDGVPGTVKLVQIQQ